MNDLTAQMRELLRIYCLWVAVCLVLWIVVQDAKSYLAGLILGSSISYINAVHLGRKIVQFSEAVTTNQTKRMSIGFVSRICFVLIAVMLASKLTQFSVLFTIIGFAFAPLVMLVIGIIRGIKSVNK